MSRRYEVSDEQWEVLKTYLGNFSKQTGDHNLIIANC